MLLLHIKVRIVSPPSKKRPRPTTNISSFELNIPLFGLHGHIQAFSFERVKLSLCCDVGRNNRDGHCTVSLASNLKQGRSKLSPESHQSRNYAFTQLFATCKRGFHEFFLFCRESMTD
jgi:hypothetical protein